MNKVGKMFCNTDTNIIRNGKKQDNLHPVYTLVYLKAVIREFIDKLLLLPFQFDLLRKHWKPEFVTRPYPCLLLHVTP